jgi:protein O-mannosyl-transferase
MGRRTRSSRERQPQNTTVSRRWPAWIAGALLLVVTFAAYAPAWRGGLLWDDDKHVTVPELRSFHGLTRIWTELGATQQYYPLAHSAFWIEHRLFGDATPGYHLVNIGLHALSAFLLLVILRRLAVRGALLAAAIFALHPVQVESVAWISELKNTLSGVFFLLAALLYLRFDDERDRRTYAAALGVFVLALLTKSVTATLPGALLVLCWWRRGRLDWRRDVVPTVPFFVVGAAAGLFTAWVERTYIGAAGAEFHLSPIDHVLVAGRAIWFYLAKIVWPHPLVFQYPRWTIDPAVAWQYAFPIAAVALVGACWWFRRRTRAPLAAVLMFAGLLFPVLGFVNVYPFRFSFVADHFQYLAMIPIVVPFSACATTLAHCRFAAGHAMPLAPALLLTGSLAAATWAQAHDYADAVTSYRAILARNPSSWLAHANLGALLRPTAPEEALTHLTEAVRLNPGGELGHYNLANLFQQTGRFDEAVREYRETIRLSPHMALAHYNLGNTLLEMERMKEAEAAYVDALRDDPGLALAHSGLCRVLQATNRPADAVRECQAAVRLQPDLSVLHYDVAGVLQSQDRLDESAAEYKAAVALRPDSVEAQNDLGAVLRQMGHFDEARTHYEAAVALSPDVAVVRVGLCGALQMLGRLDEAARECEAAVRLQPDLATARYSLANIRQQQRRLEDAIREYSEALRLEPDFAEARINLSTALAAAGRTADAREQMARTMRFAPDEASARLLRGSAFEGQGRLGEAREDYSRALQLEPTLASARQGIARIDAAPRR